MGFGGRRHASAALPPRNKPVPMIQKDETAPGPVRTDAENLAPPTRIRSPDRPAHSDSLYTELKLILFHVISRLLLIYKYNLWQKKQTVSFGNKLFCLKINI
jgi:hypothetical protein